MTTINEHGLSIELPGEWIADPNPEPGAIVYTQFGGEGVLTAMLLSVRPLFAIAEKRRLLTDYIQHRSTYEVGLRPELVQYEEEITEHDDGTVEALWSGETRDGTYQQRHRALLYDDVLVDVCIGGVAEDERVFDIAAVLILSSVKFAPEA